MAAHRLLGPMRNSQLAEAETNSLLRRRWVFPGFTPSTKTNDLGSVRSLYLRTDQPFFPGGSNRVMADQITREEFEALKREVKSLSQRIAAPGLNALAEDHRAAMKRMQVLLRKLSDH